MKVANVDGKVAMRWDEFLPPVIRAVHLGYLDHVKPTPRTYMLHVCTYLSGARARERCNVAKVARIAPGGLEMGGALEIGNAYSLHMAHQVHIKLSDGEILLVEKIRYAIATREGQVRNVSRLDAIRHAIRKAAEGMGLSTIDPD